jgi:hypothetical protein
MDETAARRNFEIYANDNKTKPGESSQEKGEEQ